MDSLTSHERGRGRILSARVRQAGLDAGIGADSTLAPFVEAVAAATEEITDIREAVGLRIDPAVAQMRVATAAIEGASRRPLLTSQQIRHDMLPKLLAAWTIWHVGQVLVAAAIGFGLCWWLLVPTLSCGEATLQNRPICFRFDGPESEQPVAAP